MKNEIYDVTIIGGGPIGLFTAFYSGMRELKTKVIEYLPHVGGKVTYFYPEKILRDIGAIPNISGTDLIKQLEQQASTFEPTMVFGERVDDLERANDGTFILTSHNGERHYTRTVILAIGHGTLGVKKLPVDGAEHFEGTNLHYAVNRVEAFKGKHVMISGGGDSAIDWANRLALIADQVTIVHRKEAFSGHESSITEMHRSETNVRCSCYVSDLIGKEYIEKVVLTHVDTGEKEELEIDALLVNHGFDLDIGGIQHWGMTTSEGKIVTDDKMQTSIPGVFAVGDIVTYPHRLTLIAGGLAEGPKALNSAKAFLDPEADAMAMYSTHHKEFVEI
ncbi:NAD(P)/FAD-dependent oxidoreductase [Bacillus sp. RAR_GA_16]|uniref:NAD(P)/FAD-dependent oxidoreductase n=1 Tax=Bacillus sp. RAR_GA_16 TaxID=2876774 RepID=UPI001CCD7B6D|nr:NAD(P)/FAD-dependent oxidoreductase [Bacillus sp. RAR_GA_16]MCA0173889.1 NAD(P)/FAD-dependent oxidoreductase [Bacillus sp. RAR_GA_16]